MTTFLPDASNRSPDDFETVAPSDSTDLKAPSRAIRLSADGDLTVMRLNDVLVTIPDCIAGETISMVCKRVMATNTAAGITAVTVYY